MAAISNEQRVFEYIENWAKAHNVVEDVIGGVKYIHENGSDSDEENRLDFERIMPQLQEQLEHLKDAEGTAQRLFEEISRPACWGIVKSRLKTIAGFGLSGISSLAATGVQYMKETHSKEQKHTKMAVAKKALPIIATLALGASTYFYHSESKSKELVSTFEKEIFRKDRLIDVVESAIETYKVKTSPQASQGQQPGELDKETESLLAKRLIKACPKAKAPRSIHEVQHLMKNSKNSGKRYSLASHRVEHLSLSVHDGNNQGSADEHTALKHKKSEKKYGGVSD